MLKNITAEEDTTTAGLFPRSAGGYAWHNESALRVPFQPGFMGSGVAVHMMAEDYREAYLELARSKPKEFLHEQRERHQEMLTPDGVSLRVQPNPPVRRLSLKKEFPFAVRAYDRAVACVRELMSVTAVEGLHPGSALPVVEDLVDSLERNPDALPCLPRMRQRDAYTYTHCVNVSVLLAAYALRMGKDRSQAITFALAGLFHDFGKALLPVSLLNARRKLTLAEQSLVVKHPILGWDLLTGLPDVRPEMLLAVLEHHERYDGSGYPKGLTGDAISEIGHIVAIADAYDAISSRRPYRGALFPHRTLGVLYQMRKKHFHPVFMEQFVYLVGIYPVGSVVELKGGCRGVVTASNYEQPMRPVVTLALDAGGTPMCLYECDLARDDTANIVHCFAPEISGVDVCRTLGIVL